VNTDVPAGVGAPPLDTTLVKTCYMVVATHLQLKHAMSN